MQQTIHLCDRCGAQLSYRAGTQVTFDVSLPKVRACAEDDSSYSETPDLCCRCAALVLIRCVKEMKPEDRKGWLAAIRSHRPRAAQCES